MGMVKKLVEITKKRLDESADSVRFTLSKDERGDFSKLFLSYGGYEVLEEVHLVIGNERPEVIDETYEITVRKN